MGLSSQVMLVRLVWGPHVENHWSGVIFLNSCILSPSDLRSNICLLKEAFADSFRPTGHSYTSFPTPVKPLLMLYLKLNCANRFLLTDFPAGT